MMLVDGRVQDRLSALDRGLHFGDGLFETIAVDAGRALCLERHLARLADGCARLAKRKPELATLAGECFLTDSLIGNWPIKTIAGQPLRAGPVAHALQKLLTGRGAITRD